MILNKVKVNNTTTVAPGVVYDISKATGQTYDTLADALSGNNVPLEIREGGMSVRFVLTSDNKYLQYRLISNSWSTNPYSWERYNDITTSNQLDSDLDFSDEQGNVLVRFQDGGIKTKNFDSSKDASESERGLMSATDKTKLNTIEQGAEKNDIETENIESSDFDIADESGNVLVRFQDGGIKTKNFDSKTTPSITTGTEDLDISDETGNVLARFSEGHFRTKYFDSRAGNSHFRERPLNGLVHFTVLVDTHIADNDSNSLNYQDNLTFLPDIGLLMLPTSYSANGVPTRMVIHCHGAGTFITSSSTHISNYGNYEDALLGLGYAIMDVNGTPGAEDVAGNIDRHFGTPIALRSYMTAYKWCMENYNLKQEIFVEGTSMGGLSSTLISELGNIPVLAQASNCPALDLFKEVLVYSWGVHNAAYKREAVAEKMALSKGTKPSTWTSTAPMSADERAFFVANIQSFIGWNSMWRYTYGLDFSAYMNLQEPSSKTDMTSQAALAEKELLDNVVKFREVPIKIWHAIDDGTVPYRYSKYYIEMCRRGGCLAELRTVPSGSHIFWDSMETVSIDTPLKGVINVKANVSEIINWFRRFE